jgi:DNA repair exonuclease SbcCD ATPase subunit
MLTILEDLAQKLPLTTMLNPDIMKDPITSTLDADMVIALKEHFQIEKQYEAALDIIRNGEGNDNSLEQLRNLSDLLTDSTRIVTRLLKMNPALRNRLSQVCPVRSAPTVNFCASFNSLKRLLQTSLRMTADEERAMKEQLASLQAQEKQDHAKFVQMHDKLVLDKNEHREILAQKDSKINELQSQIANLKNDTKTKRMNREKREKEEIETSTRNFEALEKQLKADLTKLETGLEQSTADYWGLEIQKQRQKALRKMEIELKINEYDKEMEEVHKKQLALHLTFAQESRELKKLNLYFDSRDQETERISEEVKRIQVNRDRVNNIQKRTFEDENLLQVVFAEFSKLRAKADDVAKPKAAKK